MPPKQEKDNEVKKAQKREQKEESKEQNKKTTETNKKQDSEKKVWRITYLIQLNIR